MEETDKQTHSVGSGRETNIQTYTQTEMAREREREGERATGIKKDTAT